MARRVALARAIALDPMLILYDEPFAGLDPISLGVVGQLIRKLNDALGITSVVVTHDVYESLKIVDYMYFVSAGQDRRAGDAGGGARVGRSVRPAVRRRRAGRAGTVPLSGAGVPRGALRSMPSAATQGVANGLRRLGALSFTARRPARLCGPVLRRGDREYACRVPTPPSHVARNLFLRRAVAHHHPGLRSVRRHGAGAAGLRRAAALRRRRVARRPGRAVAGARARAGGRGPAVREPRRAARSPRRSA